MDADARDGVRDVGASQPAAALERISADARNGVADVDASQPAATLERTGADFSDGVGDGDTGQPAAAIERTVADGRNGVADDNACQFCKVMCIIAWYILDVITNVDCRNICIAEWMIRRFMREIGTGYRIEVECVQCRAARERPISDARD